MRSVATEADWKRLLPFAQAGGAKPIAARDTRAGHLVGWVGAEPLHTIKRRGHRLPTDIRLPPAPRVSAGLRFAVKSWYESVDVERDHLIHRKRSPFSYKEKALTHS